MVTIGVRLRKLQLRLNRFSNDTERKAGLGEYDGRIDDVSSAARVRAIVASGRG